MCRGWYGGGKGKMDRWYKERKGDDLWVHLDLLAKAHKMFSVFTGDAGYS